MATASRALFRDLGVQVVVSGGQTLNPSTAELLAAVERANANHVVLLPGNKNIIPVAEQVDALTAKTVRVVPTRSMPEGLAALDGLRPRGRRPGQRAADAPGRRGGRHRRGDPGGSGVQHAGRRVAEGDWLGIVRGDGIVAIGGDVTHARGDARVARARADLGDAQEHSS